MKKIAIVSCRIFEDELTDLLKKQKEENEIFLLDTEFIKTIERKMNDDAIKYKKIGEEEIENEINNSNPSNKILLKLIEFSMESRPKEIKDVVYETLKKIQPHVDGIIVSYGLCGNVLGDIESDLSLPDCPVRILRDEDGDIVDDCICASLGSRRKYMQVLKNAGGEGIYFLTPMQAAYWREIAYCSGLTPDPNDDEMLKMVFEYSDYKSVGKITTGLHYEKEFDEIVEDFSKRFEMKIKNYEGAPTILEKTFETLLKDIEMI
ncbi:MAG: DUF1638 domain-containing protein [Methanimicrococcus sp.]|nr:DUF1638 domain-containing protein [Methanimicrococcus sp.]